MASTTSSSTSLLYGLSEQHARSFSARLTNCTVEEDEVIFFEREPEASLVFIRSGTVVLSRRGICVRTLGPGAVLGGGSAWAQCEQLVQAAASESVELAVISQEGLAELWEMDHPVLPGLEKILLKDLATWLRELDAQIKQEGIARPVAFHPDLSPVAWSERVKSVWEPKDDPIPTLKVEEVLARSPLMKGSDASIVKVIAGFWEPRKLVENQSLLFPGGEDEGLWLLDKGSLEVWIPVSDGRAISFVNPRQGVWVGDVPVCGEVPGHLWVRSTRPGSALHMTHRDARLLLEDQGNVGRVFRQSLLFSLMGRVKPRLDWCVGNQSGRHDTSGQVLGHHEREIWR
jgi:CRP-like cAMP-binding protein